MANTVVDGIPSKARSFSEKESTCKYLFNEAKRTLGPFWHVCTPGNLTEILNVTDEDFKFAVSNMAFSAYESGLTVVTDQQMENHLHGLLAGAKEKIDVFLECYRFRLQKHLQAQGRTVDLRNFKCDNPILIEDLEMIRTEIAYINRNGYVGNPRFVPFSYPWGGGSLYFNPYAQREVGIPFNDIPYKEKRKMTFRRVETLPDGYKVKDGMILPASYVKYELGQSMFRDSHHYFSMLAKNVEAYCAEAKRLGDNDVLSREEMYPAVKTACVQRYNIDQPSMLAPEAKLEMARTMHYDFHATNAQIRSILSLDEDYVNSLFPLSAHKR